MVIITIVIIINHTWWNDNHYQFNKVSPSTQLKNHLLLVKLKFKQDGIDLSYVNPDTGKEEKVPVDTTAKPGSNQ